MAEVTQKKKEAISLLKVLAQGSTNKARELLQNYGKGDARDYTDLETKLAQLYATYPDKVEIEKHFADIHPHKDFILKYNEPKTLIETEESIGPEKKSNCEGCGGTCGQKMSNACGCFNHYSGFSGNNKDISKADEIAHRNNSNLIIGAIAIVGLIGLLLHYGNKKLV